LRNAWTGSQREIKGNALDEEQTAETTSLLIERGCLFFVCATEMSVNSNPTITNFQQTQAEYISENVSDSAPPLLRRQVSRLRRTYEKMPAQLFLQSVLLTDSIFRVINQASIHFAMKRPPELGAFRWVIDGKDKKKTAYEAA
jgi:hypothetical protein